jgi:Arc/MetJ-type ribon-helix-helix transcriptional regulator
MSTPEHQITLYLSPDQHKKIDALLEERRRRTPFASRSDVIRDLLDLGLHRENKRRRA